MDGTLRASYVDLFFRASFHLYRNILKLPEQKNHKGSKRMNIQSVRQSGIYYRKAPRQPIPCRFSDPVAMPRRCILEDRPIGQNSPNPNFNGTLTP
jgi:hypothetical protein